MIRRQALTSLAYRRRLMGTRNSIFQAAPARYMSSFLNESGEIQYQQDPAQGFPYYKPPQLLTVPAEVGTFAFNQSPVTPANPFGKVVEDSNHTVYRTRGPQGKIWYLKDLSSSKMNGPRDEETARFVTYQECFASWLMYQIFGPNLIPEVIPVKFKNRWGIASSEVKYFGTLCQLAQRLGHSEREIAYGATALRVINGQTFLMLGEGKEPVRVAGRIALKVALSMLVAHYDVENYHKNIFMILVPDPVKYRQVACPGLFDLGCVFSPEHMRRIITASEDPLLEDKLACDLADNPVDAHVRELNVEDYEKITRRFQTKYQAFQRTAGLPWENIEMGLTWFKKNAPSEAREHIDTIRTFMNCSKVISHLVLDKLLPKLQLDETLDRNLTKAPPLSAC